MRFKSPTSALAQPLCPRGQARAKILCLAFCLLLVGTELLLPASLRGEESSRDLPTFFIEDIRIEGLRQVSEGILLAESRLQAGSDYDEVKLRKAIYRLLRLPFVLEANFFLRKGSERGRYVLEITIEEARRFFYFGELVAQDSNLDSATEVGSTGVVGWRQFLRRAEMLFAAIDADGIQAGYSHYDLFGKGLFLNLSYSRDGCCLGTIFPLGLEPVETITSTGAELGQLILGLPLHRNQSLFLSASQEESTDLPRRARQVALSWVRDTSDDPFFPTRGVRILAQLQTTDLDFRLESANGLSFQELESTSSLTLSSTQHWPIGDGHAISMILQGGVGRSESRNDGGFFDSGFLSSAIGARFSANLLRSPRKQWSDLRWETSLLHQFQATFDSQNLGFFDESFQSTRVSTSIALRHDWGILRLGFVYLWGDELGQAG